MKVALIAVTISVTPIYQIATQTCLRLENGWECNQPIRFIPLKFCSVHKFLCMQLHQTTLFPVWGSGTETAFSPAAHTSCTQLAGLKIVLRLTYHFFFYHLAQLAHYQMWPLFPNSCDVIHFSSHGNQCAYCWISCVLPVLHTVYAPIQLGQK